MLGTCPDSDVVVFPELCVTGYTCADLFGQARLLDAARAGHRPDRRRDGGPAAARRRRAADPGRQQPVQLRAWRSPTARSSGSCPSSSCPTTRSSTRADGSARRSARSRRRSSWAAGACRSASTCCSRRRAGRVKEGRGAGRRGRDLRGPLGAGAARAALQAMAGATVLREPLGEQRDDRQEPVSHRPGRRAVGPMRGGLRDGRLRADRVDHRRRLRRALPDRRERRAAGGVAPGGRRPADPPRLVRDHPRRGRRPAADRPPGHDQLRRQPLVAAAVPPRGLRRWRPEMEGLHRDVAGTPFVPVGPRAASPLRRDLRHPVRRAGQADRAAPDRHAAEYRHLRRARFDPVAAGRRDDLRHAGPRPPPGPRADDARLRHDPADADQRPGPDGPPGRLVGDDRHQRLALEAFREMGHAPFGIDCPRHGRRAFRAALARVPHRVALRPDVRERPGPAADVPADVAGGSSSAPATSPSWRWAGAPTTATT